MKHYSIAALLLSLSWASSNISHAGSSNRGFLDGFQNHNGHLFFGRMPSAPGSGAGNFELLSGRQEGECPGYVPCTNVPGECCPDGDVCLDSGCCPADPPGMVRCPGDSPYCYNPDTEICCEGGSCPKTETCCGSDRCCPSTAFCGDDGLCSTCFPATVTRTETTSSWTTALELFTETVVAEPDEYSDFSCLPMTVTNALNDSLSLATDCVVHISPLPTSTAKREDYNTPVPAPTAAPVMHSTIPWQREVQCTPSETETETVTSTYVMTTTTSRTRTRTTTLYDGEFTCIPMAVTNTDNLVLVLDKSCSMSVTQAPPVASSTDAPSSTNGGSSTPKSSSASISIPSIGLGVWKGWVIGILCTMVLMS